MKRGLILFILIVMWVTSCGSGGGSERIAVFPLNDTKGVLTQSNVEFDSKVSSDKHGSLKVTTTGWTTIRLFEVPVTLDQALIVYEAKLKTENLDGQAYIEMWVNSPGRGEFFSKGLKDALSGTVDWTTVSTPFFLYKGEIIDRIKLNLVVTGPGTVWIDDIKLTKSPIR